MDVHALGNVDDELDIGVVVVVCATGDLDVVVRHPDVIGIGLKIFWRGHHCELDGPLVVELLVRPFSYRPNLLDGSDTVVGN